MTVCKVTITRGLPEPLGATPDDHGVNFAVFSDHATRIEVCLFSDDGMAETARLPLPGRSGSIHHGHVAGLRVGQLYGLRAHGPYAPDKGHHFNPAKLLIDPYARRLTDIITLGDAHLGSVAADDGATPVPCDRDSAAHMPKCVVTACHAPPPPRRPRTPWAETVLYEAHVRGLTLQMPGIEAPGLFSALGEAPVIDHLRMLGVTAIELLPVQAFLTDRFLLDRGLSNYWGYQPIAWFAPHPPYVPGGDAATMRETVDRLHAAGIEVILDVVYNHNGEGGADGPTLSLRGLDNASYFRLDPTGGHIDDTGCGNTLNLEHPMVLRLVMDSLRHWVQVVGVDGFRFDLAATLGRTATGFSAAAPFFSALRQDPVLREVKLIAEPWDIGPGGYQLGGFPAPFVEWNDKFRDGVRRFWRRDPYSMADLAARMTGSAAQFDHSGRTPTASVNYVTAHDGFTLRDLVTYARKHNEANREANRDGHWPSWSDNLGVEGEGATPDIANARAARVRAMLATLMLSQGTPMLLAGDEIGNTQNGNNNAYCQDSPVSWLDWEAADHDLARYVAQLVAFRRDHPVLRQTLFLHSRERASDGREDLFWWHPDGRPMTVDDWEDPEQHCLLVELRTAHDTLPDETLEYAILLVLNADAERAVTLPPAPEGHVWCIHLDSAQPEKPPVRATGQAIRVPGQSVLAMVLESGSGGQCAVP